jgi:hypothetical protein
MRASWLLACVVVLTACTSVQPVSIARGDQCARCRRTIENTDYAAEIVATSMFALKFRTPGCLAQYLNETSETPLEVFVTDFASKKLIRAELATFVPVVIDERTMEKDFAAFRQSGQARMHAQKMDADRTLTWDEVRAGMAKAS